MAKGAINNAKVVASYRLLQFTYGIAAIAVGLDKLVPLFRPNFLITNWIMYVHPKIYASILPMTPHQFMYLVGIIEIVAGLLVFINPRIGGYIVAAWLLVIVANLFALGSFFDIIARDLVMAAGALALAWLDEAGCGEYK